MSHRRISRHPCSLKARAALTRAAAVLAAQMLLNQCGGETRTRAVHRPRWKALLRMLSFSDELRDFDSHRCRHSLAFLHHATDEGVRTCVQVGGQLARDLNAASRRAGSSASSEASSSGDSASEAAATTGSARAQDGSWPLRPAAPVMHDPNGGPFLSEASDFVLPPDVLIDGGAALAVLGLLPAGLPRDTRLLWPPGSHLGARLVQHCAKPAAGCEGRYHHSGGGPTPADEALHDPTQHGFCSGAKVRASPALLARALEGRSHAAGQHAVPLALMEAAGEAGARASESTPDEAVGRSGNGTSRLGGGNESAIRGFLAAACARVSSNLGHTSAVSNGSGASAARLFCASSDNRVPSQAKGTT